VSLQSGDGMHMSSASPGSDLQRELDRLLQRPDVPHAVLRVEHADGAFSWAGAVGIARSDKTPMTTATPFNVAGIDKLFTAAAVLRLYERNLIELDAPITSCLPAAITRGLNSQGGTDHASQITVRHLACHTSGIASYLDEAPRGGRSLADRLVSDGDLDLSPAGLLDIVRGQLPPHFRPRRSFGSRPRVRYSDTNYLLLNAIIEAVSGEPAHVVVQREVFVPAGLRHTWYWGLTEPASPVPAEAAIWSRSAALDVPRALKALRVAYSTTGDLVTLLRVLSGGAFFERRGTWGMMQRWHRFGIRRGASASTLPGWPIAYGFGLMRFQKPRLLTPLQRMPALVGHSGSTGSWIFHCPERSLYLAGTVSDVNAADLPFQVLPRLLALIPQRG
jgi:D-alanyl-D-alanine carboxypeptidase